MKYCAHCGGELSDEAVVCTKCGCATGDVGSTVKSNNWNIAAITGFVLSFFVSLGGLILSVIACRQIRQTNENGKEFAVAGIVISSVNLGLRLLCVIIAAYYLAIALIFAGAGEF